MGRLGKRTIFGNLWGGGGGPEADPEKAKMKGNEGPVGGTPEADPEKVKMQGNEGPQGQNERK